MGIQRNPSENPGRDEDDEGSRRREAERRAMHEREMAALRERQEE